MGSLTWFASYLTGRKQMVSFRDHLSDMATVTVSVPQVSVLGSLFFILFMKDMPLNTGSDGPVDMYADDYGQRVWKNFGASRSLQPQQ